MAKDPAVLWYWNDWNGGTVTMSRFTKGCYMDLLHAHFNNGNLSLDEIKTVLGSDFGSSWPTLQKKFKQDEKGLFFNERLVFESDKRSNYSKSRKENRKGKTHMSSHMENENEDEDLVYSSTLTDYCIKKGINFSENFYIRVWNKWISFKKNQFKFKYKDVDSEYIAISGLYKLCSGDEYKSEEIVNQSISNGWKGLFDISAKKENNGEPKPNRVTETINNVNSLLRK